MLGDPTARRKAMKLKSPVTRDSFYTWDLNHRSFCRQFQDWIEFLPDGTKETWKSYEEDRTRGITIVKRNADSTVDVPDEDITSRVRSALTEFLTCLGTYCPEYFMHTVVQESTLYSWVLYRIRETFNPNTKGVAFLTDTGSNMKLEVGGPDGITFQQSYQARKEFYCSTLF